MICTPNQKFQTVTKPLHGYLVLCVGNKPPATVPAKGAYMMEDVARVAKYYQIPLNVPAVSIHFQKKI